VPAVALALGLGAVTFWINDNFSYLD